VTRSIWMTAWDLEGREPDELIDRLQGYGLNACNLAFSYHGGRMLMPLNSRRVVYEHHPGALYYPADLSRYRGALRPVVAPQAALVRQFLEACQGRRFPVHAWTVLCHNDYLGSLAPDCCIENVFGERYTYALCPSNPDVQRYVVTLCADIAAVPGVSGLDLEALSFLGYKHLSLHDKRGVSLTPEITWLLSICLCTHCREALGAASDEIKSKARGTIRKYLDKGPSEPGGPLEANLRRTLGRDVLAALLEMRRCAQLRLLSQVREACGSTPLNLRLATDPLFCGGKSTLAWTDLRSRVDAATVSFFGAPTERMAQELRRLPQPAQRPIPVYGGIVFHGPDCAHEQDVADRLDLLRGSAVDGAIFYSFSMASRRCFDWLRRTLKGVNSWAI
jgi:hypothetical protein